MICGGWILPCRTQAGHRKLYRDFRAGGGIRTPSLLPSRVTCILNVLFSLVFCPSSCWLVAKSYLSHFLLQGIFPTQRSNLSLLHWATEPPGKPSVLPQIPKNRCNALVLSTGLLFSTLYFLFHAVLFHISCPPIFLNHILSNCLPYIWITQGGM